MNYIYLANIKIKGQSAEFEFLYKSNSIENITNIYFEEEVTKNKYQCNIKKCKNRINYSYYNETCFISKVVLYMNEIKCGKFKIKLNEINNISNLEIRDNRKEIISENENPYIIFTNKYKIHISKDGIEISNKYFADKVKYEIKKQLYGIKKFKKIFIFRWLKSKKRKYYLFNDRMMYGDDNAEQLFKYINKNHPEFAKKCYFILNKSSKSIKRVKKIGNVLNYGSFKHKFMFLNSTMIISSHSSYLDNCFNPFSMNEMKIYKDIINKKFVFLQHGIIMNDVRQYHNRELITADVFITSTKDEYKYMLQDDLMYDPNMIAGTGLPRFDRLQDESMNNRIIFISPTWRSLDINAKFNDSEYFKKFQSLLSNEKLLMTLKQNKYKIKFLLHPVFAKYKSLFNNLANEYIEILETSQIEYYKMFNECNIFITDYSSIHFDVAFLKKPIIYYQFDKEYFFNKHYQKGYFDYEKDGFGKVIERENDLINEIIYYIENDSHIRKEYKEKIEETFMYLDHNNSKRVFDKIMELDNSDELNYRFNNVH